MPRASARPPPSADFRPPSVSSSSILQNEDLFNTSGDHLEPEPEGFRTDTQLPRRRRTTDTYTKIHNILADLRRERISPIDILLQVLDPDDIDYDRYRGNLYREDSTKLSELLERIMGDYNGKEKLLQCMRPHLVEFAWIAVVTPEFIENWNLDEDTDATPFLTQILETAAQTEHARVHNKKKTPQKMCKVVRRQLLYQSSNRCLAFQAEFGLFLWSTGCSRQTIDALFRCGLSVCYDSVLNLVESLADHCMLAAIDIAKDPHSFCYDNINISTSIDVEQRGAAGPAKVQSGTFGLLYILLDAVREHMLIKPIMRGFKAATGLHFNHDIKPSLEHLNSFHDQLVIVVITCLTSHNEGFEYTSSNPDLQHKVRRAIPVGYMTPHFPLRATTIEEATTRGNLLYHDDVYINQLGWTSESLSEYAIPGFHDQLTNSRIRSAQVLRAKDVNAWTRREIFQLGFGLFHLCLNLVWAILHVHRGSVNEAGSLSFFFALMDKTRLGNAQPDYHSLLAALTQVFDGLLLNAWLKECGFTSFKAFAEAKPTPTQLREIAARILSEYATPMSTENPPEPESSADPPSDDEVAESDRLWLRAANPTETTSNSRRATPKPPPTPRANPKDDVAHQNVRILARDLLMIAVLIRAISDGDIRRVEVLLPHLAMMFRGSGCNKYCTEILHFLLNLKHIWTPEFADIMRDNMIICISGGGPGHCMPIDLNIEHLIGYLKILLHAKGMSSTWDRLGNISAAIVHLQRVKKKVSAALDGAYKNTGHSTPDTSHLVWRVQRSRERGFAKLPTG
ncbi:hypothetical protein B0H17DRAFT_1216787 [Mycena rosella]|uniref:DUF6589 domain-containing protein n=1 Tax=Mycena rosella TaxID=1033263 RepID=A0AAD7FS25_MYCRO|nr:hypothetical protein B0H17DRAFT_1216787 [Mycena rosella]